MPELEIYLIDLDCPVESVIKGFEKISFVNTKDQLFICYNTDLMSNAVANRLLKVVEEPPANTSFLFLANNTQKVLPTILSRCSTLSHRMVFKESESNESKIENNPLFKFFGQEFKAQDLQTLLNIIAAEQTEDLEDIFEQIWTNANTQNNCQHQQLSCDYFCRLEEACKALAKSKQKVTSSKLLWQALFCLTIFGNRNNPTPDLTKEN